MSTPRVELLDVLRAARRAAGDLRKLLLALYGLLLFVPGVLVVVAIADARWSGGFGTALGAAFLRPVQATVGLFERAFLEGAWGVMAAVVLGAWLLATAIGAFFGLAITRMAAIELTCARRAEVSEALRFARRHWFWALLTPGSLVLGALALVALAAGVASLGSLTPWLIVAVAPLAFLLVLAAVVLLTGYIAGGILAWPAIATEWSDAFDAITRVYGYSFTHAYRILLYRAGALLALLAALVTRGIRVALVLAFFFLALVGGLGSDRARALVDATLLEPAQGLPMPDSLAAWTLLACVAVYLTLVLARMMVFHLVLRQAIYLVLRLRVDRVPMDNIDGYRPDDSDFDPTAQGFELVEVEEELPVRG